MRDSKQLQTLDRHQHHTETGPGFTLIEVMISILVTLIVMASVFALLTRGQRTFQREPEIADLQQSARTVLDMVSRDVLQAGSGLPPEYPAFSRINGAGDGAPTDIIEVIGTFQMAGELYVHPEEVSNFVASEVVMTANTTNFEVDDMVVVYNDATNDLLTPKPPQWAMGKVTDAVDDPNPLGNARVTVDFGAYDPAYSRHDDVPPNPPTRANFFAGDSRPSKMTRVSVVRYFTQSDNPAGYNGPPPQVLMRVVDFSPQPQAVGYLENFQIRYIIGVTAPIEQDVPPDPVIDLAGATLTSENMLSGVRLTVTGRSITAGMEGASEGGAGRSDDFIRKTFSTNVNPRNVSAGLDVRTLASIQ